MPKPITAEWLSENLKQQVKQPVGDGIADVLTECNQFAQMVVALNDSSCSSWQKASFVFSVGFQAGRAAAQVEQLEAMMEGRS
jgi:hypothetical protein